MKKIKNYLPFLLSAFFLFSCNNSSEEKTTEIKAPKLKEENISYKIDSLTMDGYIVYNENIEGKSPAVLVVHEWWGLNDYVKKRARQLLKSATLPWQWICMATAAVRIILLMQVN